MTATTKKPSPAQLAARAKFAAMAKARAGKKATTKKRVAENRALRRKPNPSPVRLTAAEKHYREELIAEGKWKNPKPETVKEAYAAHVRTMHKIAERKTRAKNPSIDRYAVTATAKHDGESITLYFSHKDNRRGILVFTDTLTQAKVWNDRRDATMAKSDLAQFTVLNMVKPHPVFKVKKLGN